jgi:hypothetical protein
METANDVMQNWVQSAREHRLKIGTRELTPEECDLCVLLLQAVAGDLSMIQPPGPDLASQEPPAMHELPMYKGRFRCKQHNAEQGRCTLPEGHEGQHLAETGTAMWDAESVPAPSVTRPTPATLDDVNSLKAFAEWWDKPMFREGLDDRQIAYMAFYFGRDWQGRRAGSQDTVLREAAESLLRKLDKVAEDTKDMFVLSYAHGQRYTGANWSEEYAAVRAALAGERA